MTEDKRVTEGKLRAAQMRAIITPEQRATADALVASVPELLRRAFVGPANDHGRQSFMRCTCPNNTCPVHDRGEA